MHLVQGPFCYELDYCIHRQKKRGKTDTGKKGGKITGTTVSKFPFSIFFTPSSYTIRSKPSSRKVCEFDDLSILRRREQRSKRLLSGGLGTNEY